MNYVSKKMMGKIPYEPICGEYKLRLDANESPFGLSEDFVQKIALEVAKMDINRYPDSSALELRHAFADKFNLNINNIVAGNGSDELISVIMTSLLDKGDKIAVAYPDFSMYAFYAQLSENEVCIFDKPHGYNLNMLLDFVIENKARAVVLSNPCNPSSQGFPRDEVIDFIEKCPALCIIDEAYMDFWDQSVLDVSDKYENLIILKTLSKAFGCAGIRIGFAIGHISLINALNVARSPYNINSISQKIGTLILKSDLDRSKFLSLQAQKLQKELSNILSDATVFPTCTNFVYLEYDKSEYLYNELLKRSVAIRFFKPNHLRITTSTDEDLQVLYSEIKNILN